MERSTPRRPSSAMMSPTRPHPAAAKSGSGKQLLASEAKSGSRSRASSANAATPKKVREELLKAVYQGATAGTLEGLLKQAARLGMEEDEYVRTGWQVARLLRLKPRVRQCLTSEDLSGLHDAREVLREVANKEKAVMQSDGFNEALKAIDCCSIDIEAVEAMESKDVQAVEDALVRAQQLGSKHTISRIQEFFGDTEVAGQQNDYLRQQLEEANQRGDILEQKLKKTQGELKRSQKLLEEQDGLVGDVRGERDEARQRIRELEEEHDAALAEAHAETNLVQAELDAQKQHADELHQRLAAAERELRGRRVANSSAEASVSAAVALGGRRLSISSMPERPSVEEEKSELIEKTRREELLETQVQRLTEKIAIYQRMYRIGIV